MLDSQQGGQSASNERPFQIDRCHALRSDGETVRTFYPRWYLQGAAHNPQRCEAAGEALLPGP